LANVRIAMLVGVLMGSMPAKSDAHHLVGLRMTVTLDQVNIEHAELSHRRVGQVDELRIVYDADSIDPSTHRVKLINFQHLVDGEYMPSEPDPVAMPVADAWLDLGKQPYRLHLRAVTTRAEPIVIEADELTQRLTIRSEQNLAEVLLSGPYRIDPTPSKL
jgi:hypothetical protein